MQAIKIIHVLLGKANPERQNGVNKVVYELAKSQKANQHSVWVWGITKNPVVNFAKRNFRTKLFKDSKSQFKLSRQLKKAIEKESSGTIFHLHGAFLPQLYAVAKHLKRNGQAYIYTPHGAFNDQAIKRSKWKKRLYIECFEKFIVRNATYVHVIGKSEIFGTQAIFGESIRIELIPNGQQLGSRNKPKLHQTREITHFGFLGRLDLQTKGIDILINGFAEFLESGGAGVLHIGGDGKDAQNILNHINQKGIASNVQMHGAIFGEAKDRFLAGLDFLCLTSRNEGLPGVVLESLALKIPCIVSPETNMGAFISDFKAGFTLAENTAKCLVNELSNAAAIRCTPIYYEQCDNAFQLVEKEFQWTNISSRLIQKFYEN